MAHPPRIAILVHERDPHPAPSLLCIWRIRSVWEAWGYQTRVLRGVRAPVPEVDVLIPQVNLTRTPVAYQRYIERFPRVLNRRVTDISKRRISPNLLTPESDWTGPVIVKTDLNHGGLPEAWAYPWRVGLVHRLLRRLGPEASLALRHDRVLDSHEYRVYDELSRVPREVWSNRHLVVEKFLAERRGDSFGIRICLFLGDVVLNRRLLSRCPVIKDAPEISEEAPVPPELTAFRHRMGLDYGKIDYVVGPDGVHILDANRTPGVLHDAEATDRICRKLAAGISSLLEPRAPA